jgi:hypothetical protein
MAVPVALAEFHGEKGGSGPHLRCTRPGQGFSGFFRIIIRLNRGFIQANRFTSPPAVMALFALAGAP